MPGGFAARGAEREFVATGTDPRLFYNRWCSRPLSSPSLHRQNPFVRRSFPAALALCEDKSRRDNFQKNPPLSGVTDDAPKKGDSLDHAQSDTTPENADAGSARASRSRPRTTRLRALRPLLLPPIFPTEPTFSNTTSEPPPSEKPEEAAETNVSAAIALVGLPPNTPEIDIRPVFQRFGEVKRITVHPGGRNAEA